MLSLGLDLNLWPWVWLGVAVVFTIVELTVLGGNFILLPWAISAFVASLLGFAEAPVVAQWLVFAIGGAMLFGLFYRLARRFTTDHALPVGGGAGRLVGAAGTVIRAIDPADVQRGGRVSVDGEQWGALAADDTALPAGTRIRVRAIQGTRLVVEPFPATEPRGTP
ncbi:MAG: NfeD family protein [Acidimicrobiales bacterium]